MEQNPLLPNDPHARAVARFWKNSGDDKKANFLDFFKGAGEEQARAAKDAQEHLRIFEEHGLAFWLEAKEEAAGVQVLEVDSVPRLEP